MKPTDNVTTVSVAAVILAVIGAIAYLGGAGTIGSNGVESILVLVLASVGITGVVHTTGGVIERTNGTTTTIVPGGQTPGSAPTTTAHRSNVVVLPDPAPTAPADPAATMAAAPAMPRQEPTNG